MRLPRTTLLANRCCAHTSATSCDMTSIPTDQGAADRTAKRPHLPLLARHSSATSGSSDSRAMANDDAMKSMLWRGKTSDHHFWASTTHQFVFRFRHREPRHKPHCKPPTFPHSPAVQWRRRLSQTARRYQPTRRRQHPHPKRHQKRRLLPHPPLRLRVTQTRPPRLPQPQPQRQVAQRRPALLSLPLPLRLLRRLATVLPTTSPPPLRQRRRAWHPLPHSMAPPHPRRLLPLACTRRSCSWDRSRVS